MHTHTDMHECSDHHVEQTAHSRDKRWTWFLFEVSPKHPDWQSVQLSPTAASMCCTERATVGSMPVKLFPACLPEYFPVYLLLTFYLQALWPNSLHSSARGQRLRNAEILQVLLMKSLCWDKTLSLWSSQPHCYCNCCVHCQEQLLPLQGQTSQTVILRPVF